MKDPVLERSCQLAEIVGSESEPPLDLFRPQFYERVDVEQLSESLTRLQAEHGKVAEVRAVGPLRPGSWVLEWRYEDGTRQLQHIMVEASPPHRIGLLHVGPPWQPDEVDDSEPASTTMRLPFSGRWHVTWGGRTLAANYHRSRQAQRYAYDFSMVENDSAFANDGSRNEDHHCYGQDILAPAAGRVVFAVDGVPDNPPGTKNEEQPLGNAIILEHEGNEFSLLAHLKYESVQVHEGDRVETGQKVGECGNSGQSSKPHLHFHVQRTGNLSAGIGLPPRFVRIRTPSGEHDSTEPVRGEWVENL